MTALLIVMTVFCEDERLPFDPFKIVPKTGAPPVKWTHTQNHPPACTDMHRHAPTCTTIHRPVLVARVEVEIDSPVLVVLLVFPVLLLLPVLPVLVILVGLVGLVVSAGMFKPR